jgi:hypothetical protein
MRLDEQIQQHLDPLPIELKEHIKALEIQEALRDENIRDFLKLIKNIKPVKAPYSSEEIVAMLREGKEHLITEAYAHNEN